jgi:ABC-type sugar transport system substrate-binding protein
MKYNRKRSLTITRWAALLSAAAVLTACSTSTSGGGGTSSSGSTASTHANTTSAGSSLTIDMVTHASPGDSFWTVVQNGAEAAATAMGVKLS